VQGKRLWAIVVGLGVAALLTWFLTDRSRESEPLPGNATIPQIGDRLAGAGLGCASVIRNEPGADAGGNGAGGEPTESALCQIGGTDELDGPPVAALILIYDADRDERPAGDPEPPGHALISGDRWEVWVPSRGAALAVAHELGGRLELPDEFSISPAP
jgi:hypothetical protein